MQLTCRPRLLAILSGNQSEWFIYIGTYKSNYKGYQHIFWLIFLNMLSEKMYIDKMLPTFYLYISLLNMEALPGGGGYLFSCSPEINWLVPLFLQPQYCLCSLVLLKIWPLFP